MKASTADLKDWLKWVNSFPSKGFTLIELLVVVMIMGILAAIALPTLLAQVGKARESEARNNIGVVNRAQQAYFSEHGDFAVTKQALDLPLSPSSYFDYDIPGGATGVGVIKAHGKDNRKNGTRSYSGGIQYNLSNSGFSMILCRATASPDYSVTSGNTIENNGIVSGNSPLPLRCIAGVTQEAK